MVFEMSYLEEDLEKLAAYIGQKGFAGSTVLITGATGLIGSLCVRAFLAFNDGAGHPVRVIALARNPQKARDIFGSLTEQVEFVYQDIAVPVPDEIACDYIIHTANSTSSKYFMTNPVEVIESIYAGTREILRYGAKHRVRGMVYLSSMEVFGRVSCENRIVEEELGYLDIQNVRSCYPEGKRLAELLCKSYAEEYGLPVRVARLAQTFGAGVPATENRVFAQFARSALRGEDIVLHTKGQSVGNYCYTTDAIRALLLLLKDGGNGEVYTVVNEETTRSIAEMARMVAERFSCGRSKLVFDIPEGNAFGYAPDTKMRLSSRKLRALGWKPEISLEEMYRRMLPDMEERRA